MIWARNGGIFLGGSTLVLCSVFLEGTIVLGNIVMISVSSETPSSLIWRFGIRFRFGFVAGSSITVTTDDVGAAVVKTVGFGFTLWRSSKVSTDTLGALEFATSSCKRDVTEVDRLSLDIEV